MSRIQVWEAFYDMQTARLIALQNAVPGPLTTKLTVQTMRKLSIAWKFLGAELDNRCSYQ